MVTNGRPQAAGAADAKERRTAKRSANKRPAVDANNSAKERRTARRCANKRRDAEEAGHSVATRHYTAAAAASNSTASNACCCQAAIRRPGYSILKRTAVGNGAGSRHGA